MELTVYRQSSKQRPDGTIVYKGEDARPFVDDRIFFVADGLGGAAAIRHQQINPDLFDREKLMDVLFNGVYEEYDDERFVKYVTDSFFELFAVKDCYTDNIYNIKKSGYFASRIVTAILLHEMIYDSNLNSMKLFELLNSVESTEKKAAVLKECGDYFAAKIRDDMRKIAKNANLFYESSYSGLALLGSTLCATIYHEKEDAVEAIYLTAGDSRPYVWTETDGLCQIIEDQEGDDGGMTNYIKANEGEAFGIRCNYMQFKKPCVLFNASDGCFDSGYFLSQMAFEKLILEKAVESNDITSMGESIYEAFLTYGRHDDSSTMAMKVFGYDSFSAFQNSASRRLERIQEAYLSKLPDVLENDYVFEYGESTASIPRFFSEIKTEFEEETAVRDFYVEKMISEKYPPFESRLHSIEERIAEAQQQIAGASKTIEDIVKRNYIRFVPRQSRGENWGDKRTISKIYGIDEKHQREAENFVSLIEGYRAVFDDTTKQLKSVIERVVEIGVPSDFSDYDEISISVVEECDRSMESLFDFFYSVKEKKQGTIRQLAQLRKDYIAQNLRLASGNEENLRRICERIVSGGLAIETIHSRILQDDFEKLKQELVKIKDAEKLISALNKEERTKAFKECLRAYWEENYVTIIAAVVSDLSVSVPDDLRVEAKAIVDEVKAQTDELKSKAELQAQLFRQYDASYGRYLGGKH